MFLEKFFGGSLLKFYEIRNVSILCCHNTGSLGIALWETEKGKAVKTMNLNSHVLTCEALRQSIGTGNQGTCAEVPPSGESPPKYPNMVMGISPK